MPLRRAVICDYPKKVVIPVKAEIQCFVAI
jgi:hypothetical protein